MSVTATSHHWLVPIVGLLAITFTICTSELVIAGLLPTLATDLGVDIPTAGLLITGYAVGVAIAGPVLSLATRRVPRKTLLLAILITFIAGNVLCAVAPTYSMLLIARLLMSACHGLFFGVALVLASRLAPESRKGSAVSMVVAGVSVAIIVGVPLGTAIGNAFGWRTTFWVIAAAGAAASLVVAWLIPASREPEASHSLSNELRAAVRPVVLICYANLTVPLIAFFALLSYAVPLLTVAAGVPLAFIPPILFAMGVASFLGSLLGGRLADWNPIATLVGITAIDLVLFLILSQIVSSGWAAAVLLCLIWLVTFAFPPPLQSRVLREAADAPNLASTLMNTATQVSLAIGSAFGGFVISQGWDYGQIPLLNAIFWVLGLMGVLLLFANDQHRKLTVNAT